ncbi:MAG: aminotransferase class I/II-fold pyridoxal phosphate-dependent enzyme [Promethearchaeota archaeon]
MEFENLKKTPVYGALSAMGKRIFLPQGIIYWAGLAKKNAKINGTIGTAMGNELKDLMKDPGQDRVTFYLKNLGDHVDPGLDPATISRYAPVAGIPALRQKWKDWILEKTGLKEQAGASELLTLPVVTNGLTNGVFLTGSLFLDPGDLVLLSNKHWGNYDTILGLNLGASIDTFNTFNGKDFDIDSLVEKTIEHIDKQGKAVVLLNFPNNPSGYVPTTGTIESIADALVKVATEKKKPLVVICDDAYESYVYDENAEVRSIFSFMVGKCPFLIPVKLDGASKEFLFYGGRVGFITVATSKEWKAPLDEVKRELDNKLSGVIRSTISNASHVSQQLVLKLMEERGKSLQERQKVINVLKDRWEVFNGACRSLEEPGKGLYFDPFQGGFFAFLNLPAGVKARDFATRLIEEHKIGVIPIEKSNIGVNGIRVAYCSMLEDEIKTAIKAIKETLTKVM